MRFTTIINNTKAVEWDLSIQEAYLFAWLYELPSWANKVQMEGETFYFASKNKAVEELPILTTKVDTMYRYYKALSEKDLIVLKKVDGKDFIALTKKAKTWNFSVGNKSEYSENNPTKLGKKSETNSEKNPTYNNTSINKEISINTASENLEETVPSFVEADRQRAREAMAEMVEIGTKNADLANGLKDDRLALETICRNTKIPMNIILEGVGVFADMETAKGVLHSNRKEFRSYYINWIMSPKWLDLVKSNLQLKDLSKPKYKNESVPQYVKDRIAAQHNNGD